MIGERHHYTAGCYDGSFHHYRLCDACDDLVIAVHNIAGLGSDEGVDLGDLLAEAEETLGDEDTRVNALRDRLAQAAIFAAAARQYGDPAAFAAATPAQQEPYLSLARAQLRAAESNEAIGNLNQSHNGSNTHE